MAKAARNIVWGLAWSLIMTAGIALIPVAVLLGKGSQGLKAYGLSARGFFISYAAAGVAVGVLLGLCRPLLRRRAGAIVVGCVGGVVAFGAVAFAMYGLQSTTFIVAVPALIFGGTFGNSLWERNIEPTLPRPAFSEPSAKDTPLGRWRP